MKRRALSLTLAGILVLIGMRTLMGAGAPQRPERLHERHSYALKVLEPDPIQAELGRSSLAIIQGPQTPELIQQEPGAGTPELIQQEFSGGAPGAEPPPERSMLAMQDALGAYFYGAPDGDAASPAAALDIGKQLSSALPVGSRIASLVCKQLVCRAEIEHQSEVSQREFMQAAFARPVEWNRSLQVGEEPVRDKFITVAFFGRGDVDLAAIVERWLE